MRSFGKLYHRWGPSNQALERPGENDGCSFQPPVAAGRSAQPSGITWRHFRELRIRLFCGFRRRGHFLRLALGAQRQDVVRLVALKGSAPIVVGLVVGLGIAAVASRWIAELLYETSPRDLTVYLTAAFVLGVAALAASLIPAIRSSRVDPVTALRAD